MNAPRKPVALWVFRRAGTDEQWQPLLNERHRINTEANPEWEVAALYTAPDLQPLWALVEKWEKQAEASYESARHPLASDVHKGDKLADGDLFSQLASELRATLAMSSNPTPAPGALPELPEPFGWYRAWLPNGDPVDEFVPGASKPDDWLETDCVPLLNPKAVRAYAEQCQLQDRVTGRLSVGEHGIAAGPYRIGIDGGEDGWSICITEGRKVVAILPERAEQCRAAGAEDARDAEFFKEGWEYGYWHGQQTPNGYSKPSDCQADWHEYKQQRNTAIASSAPGGGGEGA